MLAADYFPMPSYETSLGERTRAYVKDVLVPYETGRQRLLRSYVRSETFPLEDVSPKR